MSDFTIKIAEYTLTAWETNKAHELGFFKWSVKITHSELPEYPETVYSSGSRYMVLSEALVEVFNAFYELAGAMRFVCQTCKGGTVHYVTSVDLNEDCTQAIVNLRCHCGTDRTMEYFCKAVTA